MTMEHLPPKAEVDVLARELHYHDELYSGFAQRHFARPAVRELRRHMVGRIVSVLRLDRRSHVLSLGCGIGDTELLLAERVGRVTGVDLSPAGVRQANTDARQRGIQNVEFVEGTLQTARELPSVDAVIAIFFLHHLSDAALANTPAQVARLLRPGGRFYSLDPSRRRLSGAVGRAVIPWLMKRYQTEDERELDPDATADVFRAAGFEVATDIYDFGSSPLAGLCPGWRLGYRAARRLDDALLKWAALRRRGSNFEIVARRTG